jgi:hypothetical protein
MRHESSSHAYRWLWGCGLQASAQLPMLPGPEVLPGLPEPPDEATVSPDLPCLALPCLVLLALTQQIVITAVRLAPQCQSTSL